MSVRQFYFIFSISAIPFTWLLEQTWVDAYVLLWVFIPVIKVGLYDITQRQHTILKQYPVIGHFRFLFESIRPEIQQYFVESNTNGMPINREFRALIYQRAKGQRDTRPFGTIFDVYRNGYEWVDHSLAPKKISNNNPRIRFGGKDCSEPYYASPLNISAKSFGALSKNAILALNKGAKIGSFYHNTGEGGTGAAPVELTNSVGMPLRDGLIFVHNALMGISLRNSIRLIASGKAMSAFHMLRLMALGADTVNAARAMMFALGCIQSRKCNEDTCPTGIATQNPVRYKALDIDLKAERVARYHASMITNLTSLLASAGLEDLQELKPWHINRRVNGTDIRHYGELYPCIAKGCLLHKNKIPDCWKHNWE